MASSHIQAIAFKNDPKNRSISALKMRLNLCVTGNISSPKQQPLCVKHLFKCNSQHLDACESVAAYPNI